MPQKELYVAKMEAQLSAWREKLDAMKTSALKAGVETVWKDINASAKGDAN